MMTNKNAIIVTCPSTINYQNFKEHYFIGVERGCLDLIAKNITIDLAISDFDHVSDEEFDLIKKTALGTEILEAEKDYIDGEIAIQAALKLGFKKIIYVAQPTIRHDMNLANFYLAFKYDVDVLSEKSLITVLKPGTHKIEFDKYQDFTYISFIAKNDTLISIQGLKYEAQDLKLDSYGLQAISNCFVPYKDGKIKTDSEICMVLTK